MVTLDIFIRNNYWNCLLVVGVLFTGFASYLFFTNTSGGLCVRNTETLQPVCNRHTQTRLRNHEMEVVAVCAWGNDEHHNTALKS